MSASADSIRQVGPRLVATRPQPTHRKGNFPAPTINQWIRRAIFRQLQQPGLAEVTIAQRQMVPVAVVKEIRAEVLAMAECPYTPTGRRAA